MARKPRTVSQQLREAIDASGMSRYAICKAIGLPESTMSHFMHGECGLQLSTIDKIGELLGLKLTAEKKAAPARQARKDR
jgi:ribosome-binding protein aMBF1 (putative translation factor)